MNRINRFIHCIIDDLKAEDLFRLINRGLLPNLKKLMIEGTFSRNCITDFPAVTYPTHVSMICGTHTGDYRKELCHGVPLYNWMERGVAPPLLRSYGTYGSDERIQIYKMGEDIGQNCQTILEMVEEGNKASVLQFINKGANYFYPETKVKLAFYYLLLKNSRNMQKFLYRVNTLVIKKLLEIFNTPHKFFELNEAPIASLIWFVSPDILLHLYGPNSKQYILNLIHIDKLIGLLLKELNQMGYLDDCVLAIASDHGNYKAKCFGNLKPFTQSHGIQNYHPRKNVKGTINIVDFVGIGFINVKPRDCYSKLYWYIPKLKDLENYGPNKMNLLSELFKVKGCELLYYRDDNNDYRKGIIHLRRKFNTTGKIISGYLEYRGVGKEFQVKYFNENQDYDIFDVQLD
jgi:hypothetical protein